MSTALLELLSEKMGPLEKLCSSMPLVAIRIGQWKVGPDALYVWKVSKHALVCHGFINIVKNPRDVKSTRNEPVRSWLFNVVNIFFCKMTGLKKSDLRCTTLFPESSLQSFKTFGNHLRHNCRSKNILFNELLLMFKAPAKEQDAYWEGGNERKTHEHADVLLKSVYLYGLYTDGSSLIH